MSGLKPEVLKSLIEELGEHEREKMLGAFSPRQERIIRARCGLNGPPVTLAALAREYFVSPPIMSRLYDHATIRVLIYMLRLARGEPRGGVTIPNLDAFVRLYEMSDDEYRASVDYGLVYVDYNDVLRSYVAEEALLATT